MALVPGTRLGPYEIVAPLGGGGMGEVYRARDARLGREVAIKVVRSELAADPDRLRRFEQEALAAGQLNHPNILAVYDFGCHDGLQYLVTELLAGQTLRQRLQDGPLSAHKALVLGAQIAHGLGAAHAKGIVHRDLKPENVFLASAGTIRILDFGLAKLKEADASDRPAGTATESGMPVGTASYMSPEQVRGRPVDHRSDIFAFGSVFYEMLTGRRAFHRDSPAETMAAIARTELPQLAGVLSELQAPLERLLRHCLEQRPDERFQSAQDLAFALEALAPAPAEADSGPPPLRRWLGAGMAAGLSLVAGAVVAVRLLAPPAPDLSSYRFTPVATDAAYEDEPAFSPDGASIAYVAEDDVFTQVFVRSLAASAPVRLTRFTSNDCWGAAWSPDGSRIYFHTGHAARPSEVDSIWAVSTAGGSPEPILQNAILPTISPDGKTLAFLRLDQPGSPALTLWLASPSGAQPRRYTAEPFASRRYSQADVEFSPRGDRLAAWIYPLKGDSPQELWILPWPTGRPYLAQVAAAAGWKLPTGRWPAFSWMPNGRGIVFSAEIPGAHGEHLWLADLEDGTARQLTVGTARERYPSVSPDGRRIVYKLEHDHYDLAEIPLDGSQVRLLLSTSREERDPDWSPRGRQYVYVTDRAGSAEIWLRHAEEGWDRAIVTRADFSDPTIEDFGAPDFAPDGQRIAYQRVGSSGRGEVWISHLNGSRPVRLHKEEGVAQVSPSWSPDGEWIIYIRLDSRAADLVKVRVGAQGKPIELKKGLLSNATPQWSPSGKWIVYRDDDGLHVLSGDGRGGRRVSPHKAVVFGWSADDATIYTVRWENYRSVLAAIAVDSGVERRIADLGRAAIDRGFSLAPDGGSFATSYMQFLSDLWIIEGFDRGDTLLSRLMRR